MRRAIDMAEPNDLVLITGKGCELYIMGPNRSKESHDDREVARKAIRGKSKGLRVK